MAKSNWVLTPEIEKRLQAAYENYQYGDIEKIAREFGIPSRRLSAFLTKKYGVNVSHLYRYTWSTEEILILKRYPPGTQLSVVQQALISAGFRGRNLNAIRRKRNRLQLGLHPDREGNFSVSTVAQAMGASRNSVTAWIRRGWLRAYRPTGHTIDINAAYTITPKALKEFIIEYVAYIGECWPKADRYFIVDILTERSGEKAVFEKRMEG